MDHRDTYDREMVRSHALCAQRELCAKIADVPTFAKNVECNRLGILAIYKLYTTALEKISEIRDREDNCEPLRDCKSKIDEIAQNATNEIDAIIGQLRRPSTT